MKHQDESSSEDNLRSTLEVIKDSGGSAQLCPQTSRTTAATDSMFAVCVHYILLNNCNETIHTSLCLVFFNLVVALSTPCMAN